MSDLSETQEILKEPYTVVDELSARKWMKTPNEAMDGRTPEDLIASGEGDEIRGIILRLQCGIPG